MFSLSFFLVFLIYSAFVICCVALEFTFSIQFQNDTGRVGVDTACADGFMDGLIIL